MKLSSGIDKTKSNSFKSLFLYSGTFASSAGLWVRNRQSRRTSAIVRVVLNVGSATRMDGFTHGREDESERVSGEMDCT